jgi:hypothetical protein
MSASIFSWCASRTRATLRHALSFSRATRSSSRCSSCFPGRRVQTRAAGRACKHYACRRLAGLQRPRVRLRLHALACTCRARERACAYIARARAYRRTRRQQPRNSETQPPGHRSPKSSSPLKPPRMTTRTTNRRSKQESSQQQRQPRPMLVCPRGARVRARPRRREWA